MDQLIDTLLRLMQQTIAASDLTDLVIGTVTKTKPLQITEKNVSDPIPAAALLLTESVTEKKIPVLRHRHNVTHGHTIADTYTGGGSCDERGPCSEELGEIRCYEAGKALPVADGYIILNRGLAVGDRVLLLKVFSGQKYVVLSRVFEGG